MRLLADECFERLAARLRAAGHEVARHQPGPGRPGDGRFRPGARTLRRAADGRAGGVELAALGRRLFGFPCRSATRPKSVSCVSELVRKFERNADGSIHWDSQALLKVMIDNWRDVFAKMLGHAERALVGELIEVRNRWAHQRPFSYEDTHRSLDSAERLLNAVSAGRQAEEVGKMRQEVLRTMFAEQARVQTRRQSVQLESRPQGGLKAWREVVTPHPDVASGRYTEAEFAADLAQVQRGDASIEYASSASRSNRPVAPG